jgi:hypothetical protein
MAYRYIAFYESELDNLSSIKRMASSIFYHPSCSKVQPLTLPVLFGTLHNLWFLSSAEIRFTSSGSRVGSYNVHIALSRGDAYNTKTTHGNILLLMFGVFAPWYDMNATRDMPCKNDLRRRYVVLLGKLNDNGIIADNSITFPFMVGY